jgi:RNA polymerase sigma-70 factor (ECF subfamily)
MEPEHRAEDVMDIVRRAKEGDEGAFAALYQLYFAPLYRYLYFRGADKADADDLVQDVFLKAYSSFSRYAPRSASPLAYFYTIARNAVIDHYRKKRVPVMEAAELERVASGEASAEEQAAKEEDYAAVQRALAELPPDQQSALILRYIEGRSNEEIASVLGKNEAAVRQLQSRGLKRLRDLLITETSLPTHG